jgi:hypothetical protein
MRLRTDWRVEPEDEFITGPFVYDGDIEHYRAFLAMLNGSLGWEKFRLVEADQGLTKDLTKDQDDGAQDDTEDAA